MNYRIVVLIAFILVFLVSAAGAEEGGSIKKLDLVPVPNGSRFEMAYEGKGDFRVFHSEQNRSIIIEADNLRLPANLTRALDNSNKGGPVLSITPYNSSVDNKMISKIVIQLREPVEIATSDSKATFSLVMKPKSQSAQISNTNTSKSKSPVKRTWLSNKDWVEGDEIKTRASANDKSEEIAKKLVAVLNAPTGEKKYFGEKINFESSNADVHELFMLVGDKSGLNILTDANVSGKASYALKDIPWDQLLDLVLEEFSLKALVIGNIVQITTMEKYNKAQKAKLEEALNNRSLEPTIMAIIPLSYAEATDMMTMIEELLVKDASANAGGASGPVMKLGAEIPKGISPLAGTSSGGDETLAQAFVRGKIKIDKRSNSLIVTNTRDAIERIRRLIKELDVPLPQVLIDAKVVYAQESFSKALGISLGGGFSGRSGRSGGGFSYNGATVTLPNTNTSFSPKSDKGSTGMTMSIGAGPLGVLTSALALSELNGTSKTIASPRVIVNNKSMASITDNQSVTVLTPGSNGGPATPTTISGGLSLNVTPQVTSSGSVMMKGLTLSKGVLTPGAQVSVDTKSITTDVLVENGTTLVLGGVYQFATANQDDGIPYLKDLPFLGPLFKSATKSDSKQELMLFITPQVIDVFAKEMSNLENMKENSKLDGGKR